MPKMTSGSSTFAAGPLGPASPYQAPVGRYGFWQATLDSLSDSVAVLNDVGDIVAVNRPWRAFAEANGGDGSSMWGNYLVVCDAANDDVAAEVATALREVLTSARSEFECAYPCHSPERERWFSMRAVALQTGGGRCAVVSHHDITARFLAERRNHDQADLLDSADAAVMEVGLDRTITQWSAGAERLFGWTAAEIVGRPVSSVALYPGEEPSAESIFETLLRTQYWDGQLELAHRDGTLFPAHARTRLLRDAGGQPRAFVGIIVDLSERVAMEGRVREARDFLAAITQTIPDGLLVIDARGETTYVNEAAEEMLGCPREELVGQPIQDRIVNADGSAGLLEPAAVGEPRLPGEAVRVEDQRFRRQDGSLMPVSYAAAPLTFEAGEDGWVIVFRDITEQKKREHQQRQELETLGRIKQINDALEHDRFILYAQPIVDIATAETVLHELLLRMVGDDGEIILPGAFLPVAEEHGLICSIDRSVINKALAYGADGHRVAINVSAASLSDPHLLGFVERQFAAHGAPPSNILFELTETALIGNEKSALLFVETMTGLGCDVALDDFGTGYGSFHYLKQLPVTRLKIDMEFVHDLDGDDPATSRHVIEAIVNLARGLGKTTIAEGVETASSRAILAEMGVDLAQGYLFGRPVPADQLFGPPQQTS